jgi:DNA-binding MarR family transcriptional regulator
LIDYTTVLEGASTRFARRSLRADPDRGARVTRQRMPTATTARRRRAGTPAEQTPAGARQAARRAASGGDAGGDAPRAAPEELRDARLDALLADFELTRIVSHLLRRAHFRAEDIFVEQAGSVGMTPRQKALLITAYQRPGASQSEIAEAIAIDPNTVAEMVSRMVRAGLLRRRRAPDDARANQLFVTRVGIDALMRVMPLDRRVERLVIAPLPPEYRPLFAKCLRLMLGMDSPAASAAGATRPHAPVPPEP